MKKSLRTIDLNLLVALDAFVTECNVTRTAIALGISQPAASNTLKRLRELFDDELLVRTSTGMEPTQRALELQESVVPILRGLERISQSRTSFDPARSTRQFTVRMSDVLEQLLLPHLVTKLLKHAPHASLRVINLAPQETLDALEEDRLDVGVSMGLTHPTSIRSKRLFSDRMVCVMRAGHPLATLELTIERFLQERHIRVAISPTDRRFVDNILGDMSLSRDVALQTQHWTVLERTLQQTDLLSVMPESLARGLSPHLTLRRLPFASQTFDWRVYWHKRHDKNPGQAWLIDLITEAGLQRGPNLTGTRPSAPR